MSTAAPAAPASAIVPRTPRCRNCRSVLAGPYCSRCGQRDADLRGTAGDLLREAAREVVTVDRRLMYTLRVLFTRPGQLTRSYMAGRRARCTSPLRLYLLASVLFFFAYAGTQETREGYLDARNPQIQRVREALEANPDTLLTLTSRSLLDRVWPGIDQRILAGNRRALVQRDMFIAAYSRNLSRALLVTLPVLALILAVCYVRAGRPAVTHLVFALHFGAAFLFGFLALMLAGVGVKLALAAAGVPATAGPDVNFLLYAPGGAALLVYLYRGMRRVYPEHPARLAPRFLLTALLFTVCLAVAFQAAALTTVLALG